MKARQKEALQKGVELIQNIFDVNDIEFERYLVQLRSERAKYRKKLKKTTK